MGTLSEPHQCFILGTATEATPESSWGTRPDLQLQPAKNLNTGVSKGNNLSSVQKHHFPTPEGIPCSEPGLFFESGKGLVVGSVIIHHCLQL